MRQDPYNTYRPAPQAVRMPHRRQRRTFGCLLAALIAFAAILATCSFSMLIYVIFPPAPLDLLVLGLDARPGEGNATRTDSIIVVGIQPRQLKTSLLSIPRDVFITTPGYGSQRINTINVLGEMEQAGRGPHLLSSAIEASFGIRTDRYLRLNFDTFRELIDAIGGVTIDVPYGIVDNAFPTSTGGTMSVRFEPGPQHMDGERALIYARTRHQDDDYRRAERQQQVVSAVGRKMLLPLYWPPALAVITARVDTDLNIFDMVTMIPPLIFSAGNYDQLVLNREYLIPGSGGVVPNYNAIAPWIESRFD
jgi:LCP family protein required for cell wall assembly